jgi:hypothetical protein
MSGSIFTVKQNSPVILTGIGVVGFVATTVLACRATLKMSEILEKGEKELEETQAELEYHYKSVPDRDDRDLKSYEKSRESVASKIKLKVAIEIAKAYAPSVIAGGISLYAFTHSHIILQRRNTGLAAAYMTLDQMYKRYRANVVADVGEEKDREYRFGVVEKEIVDPETGLVETARGIDSEEVKKRKKEFSDYAVMFGKENENWEPSTRQNILYLQSVIRYFEDRLRLKGRVFLNEVYEYMGYEPTEAGTQVGWIREAHQLGEGDGFISFGLEKNTENAVKFMNGTLSDVILDFNVDGVITHHLKRV